MFYTIGRQIVVYKITSQIKIKKRPFNFQRQSHGVIKKQQTAKMLGYHHIINKHCFNFTRVIALKFKITLKRSLFYFNCTVSHLIKHENVSNSITVHCNNVSKMLLLVNNTTSSSFTLGQNRRIF